MKHIYEFDLDPPSFREQRLLLAQIISYDTENILTPKELNALEGIQNLLDAIADQAHDNHGLDVLNCEDGENNETDK